VESAGEGKRVKNETRFRCSCPGASLASYLTIFKLFSILYSACTSEPIRSLFAVQTRQFRNSGATDNTVDMARGNTSAFVCNIDHVGPLSLSLSLSLFLFFINQNKNYFYFSIRGPLARIIFQVTDRLFFYVSARATCASLPRLIASISPACRRKREEKRV